MASKHDYDDDDQDMSQVYTDTLRDVVEMRSAQQRYFKSRDKADLLEAKRLESIVDTSLRDIGFWVK